MARQSLEERKIGTPRVTKFYSSRLQNTEWNVERSDRIKVRNQQAGYQIWLQTRGIQHTSDKSSLKLSYSHFRIFLDLDLFHDWTVKRLTPNDVAQERTVRALSIAKVVESLSASMLRIVIEGSDGVLWKFDIARQTLYIHSTTQCQTQNLVMIPRERPSFMDPAKRICRINGGLREPIFLPSQLTMKTSSEHARFFCCRYEQAKEHCA